MARQKTLVQKAKERARQTMASIIERGKALFSSLPDVRKESPNLRYEIADAALSAFSVFFLQFPSFLAHQRKMDKREGRNNAGSLFGVHKIPTDNRIRDLLDPVEPKEIFPLIAGIGEDLYRAGHLDSYRSPFGFLFALDGTTTFSSEKISCPSCSTKTGADGVTHYFHSAVTPVLVAPGQGRVVALPPEFVVPQDGRKKQDCEIVAASRWLDAWGPRYAPWKGTILGDDLYSREPFCRKVLEAGFDFLFVAKPSSHKILTEWLKGSATTVVRTRTQGTRKVRTLTETYRFMNGVPLKDGDGALRVNWFEITVTSDSGTVLFKNAWVTSHPITKNNLPSLADAARSRWKIENQNNNVLKTKGYNLEHNFGHGRQFLSNTLATLNILSFLLHTALEWWDEDYRVVRSFGTRQEFFQEIRAFTSRFYFESWGQLMQFLLDDCAPVPDSG
ncbi:MAG: hypothetical protein D084_Lepto4C00429G0002 [Leptospirillum sp. Group IV 'UBA BS']|jgi:Transposase DDE domain.|nr:MAG: hypothetical protein D084_Lepto4C00429G0002 [Leptospirillum sp. Group IV 'UBA BS']